MATPTLTNRGRIAVKEQGSGWGTAETSFSATDYMEIEAPFVPPMAQETLTVDTYRPDFAPTIKQGGSQTPTPLSVKMPLHGWSTATPSGDPTIHPDATILKALMGGFATDGYTTAVTTGSTTSLVNITNGSADTAWAGYAQLAAGATKNVIWWAKTIDTGVSPDTIVPLVTTLAEAPAAGTAYGSYVLWLAGAGTQPTPLTLDWLGTVSTSHFRYWDGLPTKARIVLNVKQQPMVESLEFMFMRRTNVGSGGAPSGYSYGYPQMPACIGTNGFRALFSGGSAICPGSVVIDIEQTLEEDPCGSADHGVATLVATNRTAVVTLVTTPSDMSAAPWTYTPGSTPNALQVDANTTPGRAFSLAVASPQVTEIPVPTPTGNLLGLSYKIEGLTYTGDTGSTAPADTYFRLAFL